MSAVRSPCGGDGVSDDIGGASSDGEKSSTSDDEALRALLSLQHPQMFPPPPGVTDNNTKKRPLPLQPSSIGHNKRRPSLDDFDPEFLEPGFQPGKLDVMIGLDAPNSEFQWLISHNLPIFDAIQFNNTRQVALAAAIVKTVKYNGGRFVQPVLGTTNQWCIVSSTTAAGYTLEQLQKAALLEEDDTSVTSEPDQSTAVHRSALSTEDRCTAKNPLPPEVVRRISPSDDVMSQQQQQQEAPIASAAEGSPAESSNQPRFSTEKPRPGDTLQRLDEWAEKEDAPKADKEAEQEEQTDEFGRASTEEAGEERRPNDTWQRLREWGESEDAVRVAENAEREEQPKQFGQVDMGQTHPVVAPPPPLVMHHQPPVYPQYLYYPPPFPVFVRAPSYQHEGAAIPPGHAHFWIPEKRAATTVNRTEQLLAEERPTKAAEQAARDQLRHRLMVRQKKQVLAKERAAKAAEQAATREQLMERQQKTPTKEAADEQATVPPVRTKENARMPCNCKKSKCLKLYCECFSNKLYCDGCNCIDCNNSPKYAETRNKAIKITLWRNQKAFQPRLTGGFTSSGCRCQRSECLKKYCECFQIGVVCSSKCKCVECANRVGSQKLIDKRRKMKVAVQEERKPHDVWQRLSEWGKMRAPPISPKTPEVTTPAIFNGHTSSAPRPRFSVEDCGETVHRDGKCARLC